MPIFVVFQYYTWYEYYTFSVLVCTSVSNVTAKTVWFCDIQSAPKKYLPLKNTSILFSYSNRGNFTNSAFSVQISSVQFSQNSPECSRSICCSARGFCSRSRSPPAVSWRRRSRSRIRSSWALCGTTVADRISQRSLFTSTAAAGAGALLFSFRTELVEPCGYTAELCPIWFRSSYSQNIKNIQNRWETKWKYARSDTCVLILGSRNFQRTQLIGERLTFISDLFIGMSQMRTNSTGLQ